ncbi:putative PurR-regulated permease PerM [Desulfobaculum xiamenense]|uniref:Putative PurR-regulated permease PerM n=1 Tax=Desulfobaculum xiamenense TaxID=995050 RepID=A0A846QLD2_9BACT|nr:AI-2E family transporter [Desulfobaculum xiamenense]NJB68978.1 putative PurR-regulated permease PerM [Desulfobaculum xiamenense]
MNHSSGSGLGWPTRHGKRYYSLFLFALILFALYMAYRVFSPFLHAIIFSGVLAAIFTPLFTRISARIGGHDNIAAGIVVLLVTVCIFIPAFLFLTGLATQAAQSVAQITNWIRHTNFESLLAQSRMDAVLAWVDAQLPFIHLEDIDIQSGLLRFSRQVGEVSIQLGTSLLTNAFSVLLHSLIMLFILFFLLRDGRRVIATVKYLSPLREAQEDSIIHSLRRVSRSVLVGGLLVAVLQGTVGGIGLAVVEIPALFWGTMMGFSSLIPVLGTGLVWVPASVYLLIIGHWKAALFLVLWCGILVTSIDTFLRPYFMKGASGMPLLYIFLSVIGGLQAFGPAGLLYGPLSLAFAMVMLRIYGEEYRDLLEEHDEPHAEVDGN